jgi:hypothetical protein
LSIRSPIEARTLNFFRTRWGPHIIGAVGGRKREIAALKTCSSVLLYQLLNAPTTLEEDLEIMKNFDSRTSYRYSTALAFRTTRKKVIQQNLDSCNLIHTKLIPCVTARLFRRKPIRYFRMALKTGRGIAV